MNGLIFIEIGRFAQSQIGDENWRQALRLAGVPEQFYYRVADYPDEEAAAHLSILSSLMHEPVESILTNLGEYIVPDLIKMARYWIDPGWKTLDLIANTEHTIHEMLRSEGSQTNPPRLRCRRTADAVIIDYDSPRRMCALAKGIILGVARHYGETVSIDEPACMLQGDDGCHLVVRVVPGGS
jgi:predicted hydrocarbon binding protein